MSAPVPRTVGVTIPVTADQFVDLMTSPEHVFPDGIHPSYAHLSDEDLAALATYLSESR